MRRKWTVVPLLSLLFVATAMALVATGSWRVLVYEQVVKTIATKNTLSSRRRSSWERRRIRLSLG